VSIIRDYVANVVQYFGIDFE